MGNIENIHNNYVSKLENKAGDPIVLNEKPVTGGPGRKKKSGGCC